MVLPLVVFIVEVGVAGDDGARWVEGVVGSGVDYLLLGEGDVVLYRPCVRDRIASDLPHCVLKPLIGEIQHGDCHIQPYNVAGGKFGQVVEGGRVVGFGGDAHGDVLHEVAGGDGAEVEGEVGGEAPAVLQPNQEAVVGVVVSEVGEVVSSAGNELVGCLILGERTIAISDKSYLADCYDHIR